MNMTLYGASNDLACLENLLSTEEIQNEELEKKYSDLVEFLKNKTDSVVGFNSKICDYLNAIDQRITELEELRAVVEARQKRYHTYILACLDRLGVSKVEGKFYSITARKPSQIVDITDEQKIPIEFLKIVEKTEIMKSEISKKLKAGEQVEGAQLKDGKRSLIFKAGREL